MSIEACWRRSRNLPGNRSGLSAVEFGLLSPLVALVCLGLADVGNAVVQMDNMQRALRAGTQYFMNGGTNSTVAKAVVTGAWTHKPANGSVNVVANCTSTCPSSGFGTGAATVTLTASASIKGFMWTVPESQTESVRVQ